MFNIFNSHSGDFDEKEVKFKRELKDISMKNYYVQIFIKNYVNEEIFDNVEVYKKSLKTTLSEKLNIYQNDKTRVAIGNSPKEACIFDVHASKGDKEARTIRFELVNCRSRKDVIESFEKAKIENFTTVTVTFDFNSGKEKKEIDLTKLAQLEEKDKNTFLLKKN